MVMSFAMAEQLNEQPGKDEGQEEKYEMCQNTQVPTQVANSALLPKPDVTKSTANIMTSGIVVLTYFISTPPLTLFFAPR